MKKLKYIIGGLLILNQLTAQLITPDHTTVFKKEYTFSPEHIKKNQIKKVVFEILDKKDYEAPVDKNLVEHYEFNSSGHITRFYYTDIVKTIEKQVTVPPTYKGRRKVKNGYSYAVNDYIYDTISITNLFNNANKLLMKRNHIGNGFYETRYYQYDSTLHMVQEERFKETNVSPNKSDFILGNQVLLSKDSMRAVTYGDNQVKIVYFNSEKRPYKEQIIIKKNGNVTSINESYIAASWIQQNQEFEYNSKGQLTSAIFNSNANVSLSYKHTFDYDKNGWLLTEKRYKNNVLLTESSFVNDTNSALVNSIVIRDFVNKSIRIIKLKYAYFDSIQVKNK